MTDKKLNYQNIENQQRSKVGLFKNFGKSRIKNETKHTSISSYPAPKGANNISSETSPTRIPRFVVEISSPLLTIYQDQEMSAIECSQRDSGSTISSDKVRSRKINKGHSGPSEHAVSLDRVRLRSNSGIVFRESFNLPDPTQLPECEPQSSLTFCRTPMKSADDDRYWVAGGNTEKGYFKRLSKSSISKSDQSLMYSEPSKRIEEALSLSRRSVNIPNATIEVAYRHGVNRVTENDQVIMLSKTSSRDRSQYLSEGVHYLDEDLTFCAFFQHSTCYDIMPDNSKLVVLDSGLQVGKAFRALIFNGVRAAIIWDVGLQQYVGILTITDFINILNLYVQTSPNLTVDIESETIDKWREMTGTVNKPLLYVRPENSLFIALQQLRNHKVHRLPVLDVRSGNVLHIITHKRLLKYLYIKRSKIPTADFLKQTIEECNVGTFDPVYTATLDTSVKDVLGIFDSQHISAVPIIDPITKKLVDLYAKFDCIHLASTGNYKDLNLTIAQALRCRSQTSFRVQSIKKTDTLAFAMEKIVLTEVHRLVVINNETEKLVEGIVSLADLLHYFILRLNIPNSCVDLSNEPSQSPNCRENTRSDNSLDKGSDRASSHSTVNSD